MTTRPAALAALIWLCATARPGAAQSSGLEATRPGLEQLLQRLEQLEQAQDSSDARRTWARSQAAVVRARLTAGDFRGGDRVLLRVEGSEPPTDRPAPGAVAAPGAPRSVEQQLSDTFTVGPDGSLTLPVIGVIPLQGVLRSELEGHLTREIGRYIRYPVLHARALIRVSIVGAVTRPGFYYVPSNTVLPDALMAAGGPTQDAKLEGVRIERMRERVWDGPPLQLAVAQGRTLDELNLQAGDQFVVPKKSGLAAVDVIRLAAVLASIPAAIWYATRR